MINESAILRPRDRRDSREVEITSEMLEAGLCEMEQAFSGAVSAAFALEQAYIAMAALAPSSPSK